MRLAMVWGKAHSTLDATHGMAERLAFTAPDGGAAVTSVRPCSRRRVLTAEMTTSACDAPKPA